MKNQVQVSSLAPDTGRINRPKSTTAADKDLSAAAIHSGVFYSLSFVKEQEIKVSRGLKGMIRMLECIMSMTP